MAKHFTRHAHAETSNKESAENKAEQTKSGEQEKTPQASAPAGHRMVKAVLLTPYALIQPSTKVRMYQYNEVLVKDDNWLKAQVLAKLVQIVEE